MVGTVNGVTGGSGGGTTGGGTTGPVGSAGDPPHAANSISVNATNATTGTRPRALAPTGATGQCRGMQTDVRIGIDLGGTKIEGIALATDGAELARRRVPTPRSYVETVAAITALVHQLEAHVGARGTVGLGIPGVIVPETGLVKNANSTWLIGEPLARDLERALARAVRTENDANCFALSEATDGAARGADMVFGVIMGTGVGGGIVHAGRVHAGRNLIGGEWGHNGLPWATADEVPGPACYCGRQGCIESWVSGPGVAADHARTTGQRHDAASIMEAAAHGNAEAIATRTRWIGRMARSLATVINLLDPDVIVLGGGLSNTEGVVVDLVRELPRWVFSDRLVTPVVRHHHGDSSGVRGAAWLWPATGA
nr:ROK family protein [Gemmatimonas aurantiaca]